MDQFLLSSDLQPKGDQPKAIAALVKNIRQGRTRQTLFGATGTGKTFTVASVIAQVQKPTLVIAHNKTLAAQLCSEFRAFFPKNAVSYFVSYYDYYQPEAYIPSTDTYIAKDSAINDEIDKFRHAATSNLLTRRDVIVVASVSCIYGLGSVEEYKKHMLQIKVGEEWKREALLRKLVDMQYVRSSLEFKQGMFHVIGDTVEIFPPSQDTIYRLEFWGDEIERIVEADSFTGEVLGELDDITLFPAKHDITSKENIIRAVAEIRADLALRVAELQKQGKMVEAERIQTRTEYDLEILQETGYCTGIENYTRYLNQMKPGAPATTLIDYFPKDFLMVIDESHMTIPQIGGMYNGNFSRKQTLIDYAFRLPSSHDNRPLKFAEFEAKMPDTIFISATPSVYEMRTTTGKEVTALSIVGKNVPGVVEQIIRPTGLLDPIVEVRPIKGQIPDLLKEIRVRITKNERVLVTTLTKRLAEELTDFFTNEGLKVRYLHSDIDTMERIEILRGLRLGKFDVVVGINLLREGLDLPEVSFIGILDADKEGFLRSAGALIQTIGRCARNVNGTVIMYADRITNSMRIALDETERRRKIQMAHNEKHGITPQTIVKAIADIAKQQKEHEKKPRRYDTKKVPKDEIARLIKSLEMEMDMAAEAMEFEKAAELRDEIETLKEKNRL